MDKRRQWRRKLEAELVALHEEVEPTPFERECLAEALDAWSNWNLAEHRHLPKSGGWDDQEWEWHEQIRCVRAAKRKADAILNPPKPQEE